MNENVRPFVKTLWDYHNIEQDLPPNVDFVLAAGSHDDRVAHHAASLILNGISALLVTSGGFGKVTREIRDEPEGERFKEIAMKDGVDPNSIVAESEAKNSGDNITFSRAVLEKLDIHPNSGIIATKPYMKRRAMATALKQWPEVQWWVSAPDISFENYATVEVPEQRMIELMVGDLQRIKVYAEQGFQAPQVIPDDVWDSYTKLVQLGYDKYVIKQ